jgi:cytochrome c-type biogenesis protein
MATDSHFDTVHDDRSSSSALKRVLLILAIAVAALIVYRKIDRPSAAVSEGVKLEMLDLQPLTGAGEPVRHEQLLGKVTVLNFWGTWCPPCREEFPHILALRDRYRDQPDFRLVSVSSPGWPGTTLDELKAETLDFLAMRNVDLPTYANPNNKPAIEGYPTTILTDREGIVRGYWQGYEPGMEEQIQEAVEQQLAHKS